MKTEINPDWDLLATVDSPSDNYWLSEEGRERICDICEHTFGRHFYEAPFPCGVVNCTCPRFELSEEGEIEIETKKWRKFFQ